jgi:hypothetical protein
MKRSGMTASPVQRDKVHDEGSCRECYRTNVDPAHVTPKANGGCDHPDCVIPLCRQHHREYDHERTLDVLPLLTKAEQAHAVAHVGLATAYQRLTNQRLVA